MNTPHTPGPWVVAYDLSVRPESDAWITIAQQYDGRDGSILSKERQAANARLIAAAPELLHALQLVMTWNGIYDQSVASAPKAIAEFNMEVGDKIRSAIAKATGQTP